MANGQPRTKLQHYVPRFYLERFANVNGYVWTYDISTGQSRAAKPQTIGAETNFYSPIQADGTRFDDIEQWFSKVEAAAASLFDPLRNGRRLIGADRDAMSLFLAAQYFRSPMMVHAMADMMGQFAHDAYMKIARSKTNSDEIFDTIDQENGRVTPPEERENIRERLARPENLRLDVLRDIGLPAISNAGKLARIFRHLSWATFDTSGQHVVTSDSPVVKVYDPRSFHPVYGDGGFLNKTMYVSFPLDPHRTLEMFWGSGDPGGVHRIGAHRGRIYNKQRVLHAVRSIFSDRDDVGISKLIAKNASEQRPRISLGNPAPAIHVKRRLD